MTTILLSIIIPVYNAETYIQQCVESLCNQDIDKNNYEIIIIDDGSIDKSLRCIENLKDKYKNIIIYTQKNKGPGAVRNRGIHLSKGKYIYFMDADDYLADNTFKMLITYLEKHSLDIIAFDSVRCERKEDLTNFKIIKPYKNPLILRGIDFLKNYCYQHGLGPCWYIIKREYLLKTGYRFEEGKFFEDAVFTYKIFRDSSRTMFLNIKIHRYVITHNSITNNKSQNHLKKFVKDWIDLIFRFSYLIDEIYSAQNDEESFLIESIRYRQKINVHYLFIKWLEFNFSIKKISQLLEKFKKIEIYPLKFTKDDYRQNNLAFRLSIFIFNRKYLYIVLLIPTRFYLKIRNLIVK